MKAKLSTIAFTLVLSGAMSTASTSSTASTPPAPELVQLAQAVRGPEDEEAIIRLRAAEEEGFWAMLAAHPELNVSGSAPFHLSAAPTAGTTFSVESVTIRPEVGPRRTSLDEALDRIAGQRDARFSRLFWYTDLELAKTRAAESGRPILSLRLLGQLNDELSCANSRFFRTVLYANESVSAYLRENFILHWESVRPVPVIEIDFGDGRKVKRTITGNSIHYVLDSRGRLVDGLPGLYAPATFVKLLEDSAAMARLAAGKSDEVFQSSLAEFHTARVKTALEKRAQLLSAGAPPSLEVAAAGVSNPPASAAGERTATKTMLEGHPLRQLSSFSQAPIQEEELVRLAASFQEESRLDQSSRALISYKNPDMAMRLAISKSAGESPMYRMLRNLESNIARDTAKNEFELHPRLREWLIQAGAPVDLRQFNERVYAELFLTPSSDPWLGLVPPDAYAALDQQGLEGLTPPMSATPNFRATLRP